MISQNKKDSFTKYEWNLQPLWLCTFSRVMKEKGIEDAINAVCNVNKAFRRTVFYVDIYGQVDVNQIEWFQQVMESAPDYIGYKGIVAFNKSTSVLKDYFALLFPTYYEGEGFAGTLIDALAAGILAVASDWKYNAEIVINHSTGLLYPVRNVEALFDRLVWIYEHQFEWNGMKFNCVRKAKDYLPEVVVSSVILNLD